MTPQIDILREQFLDAEVSGVLFIRDYLELQCEDSRIQFFATPVIVSGTRRFAFGEPGAADQFILRISHRLVGIELADGEFRFVFDDGVKVVVQRGRSVAGETFNTVTPRGVGVY